MAELRNGYALNDLPPTPEGVRAGLAALRRQAAFYEGVADAFAPKHGYSRPCQVGNRRVRARNLHAFCDYVETCLGAAEAGSLQTVRQLYEETQQYVYDVRDAEDNAAKSEFALRCEVLAALASYASRNGRSGSAVPFFYKWWRKYLKPGLAEQEVGG